MVRKIILIAFIPGLLAIWVPQAGYAQSGGIKIRFTDHSNSDRHPREKVSKPSISGQIRNVTYNQAVVTQSNVNSAVHLNLTDNLSAPTELNSPIKNPQLESYQSNEPVVDLGLESYESSQSFDVVTAQENQTDWGNGLNLSFESPSAKQAIAFTPRQSVESEYQLPTVAEVTAPISSSPLSQVTQRDPIGLLTTPDAIQQRVADSNTSYASLMSRAEETKYKTWKPHNFFHRPLYFEDSNLERYGNQRSKTPAFQNMASGTKFLADMSMLPYRVGQAAPNQRIYTTGDQRPGDCVQYRKSYAPNVSGKGATLQTIVALGIILP